MADADWRIDAVRTIVPLVAAFVAGGFAVRNARKTPHERLKNLVDIDKNMRADLDPEAVVVGAIARELVNFDRRLKADQEGFTKRWTERILQNRTRILAASALATAAIGLSFVLWGGTSTDVEAGTTTKPLMGVGITLALVSGVVAGMATVNYFALRTEAKAWEAEKKAAATEAVGLRRKWSQRDIANFLGWSQAKVSAVEAEMEESRRAGYTEEDVQAVWQKYVNEGMKDRRKQEPRERL